MLTNFVSIYVPHTLKGDKPMSEAEHENAVRSVASVLSHEFGGATAYRALGFWLSDTIGLVTEQVTIVKSYHDRDADEALAIARKFAQELKVRYEQEAVSIETNNGLEFV